LVTIRWLSFLALVLCPVFSAAEDFKFTRLGLRDCIEIAMRNNVDIRNAEENLRIVRSNFRVAEADFVPTMELSGKRDYGGLRAYESPRTDDRLEWALSQKIFTGGRFSLSGRLDRKRDTGIGTEDYASNVQLEFRQPLLSGGGLWAPTVQVRQMRNLLTKEQMSFKLTEQRLLLNVVSGYYRIKKAELIVKVQERALEQSRDFLRAATIRFKLEKVAEIDTLQARLRAAQSENRLILAQESLESVKEDFAVLLGLEAGQEIRLSEEVDTDSLRVTPVSLDSEEAIRTALEHRLELRQLRLDLENSRLSLISAGDARERTFDFVTSYQMSDTGDSFQSATEWMDPAWGMGFEFRMPLWNIPKREAYKRALIGHRKLRNVFANQRQQIIKEVRQAVRSVETSQYALKVLAQSWALAKETYQLRSLSYDQGLITSTEFLFAQQELTSTETSYFSALMDYEVTLVHLDKTLGVLRMERIVGAK